MIEQKGDNIVLRAPHSSDKKSLAALCNNKKIWDNIRDFVPFPYSEQDATEFIDLCRKEKPQTTFAIEYKGDFVGCIGLVMQKDIYKLSAEIGYWLGEPYWGKGIVSKAVELIVDYGFSKLELVRIFSGVFDFNKASQRVLEKVGFKLECVFEKAVVKNERILDEYRYALINPDYNN